MTKVTILRKWNNPQIAITVSDDGIGVEMTLSDFLIALADEVAEPLVQSVAIDAGNPSLWFTKETLVKKLTDAIEGDKARQQFADAASKVIDTVKQETTKVV